MVIASAAKRSHSAEPALAFTAQYLYSLARPTVQPLFPCHCEAALAAEAISLHSVILKKRPSRLKDLTACISCSFNNSTAIINTSNNPELIHQEIMEN
jgi:hypothetical protein